MFDGEKDMKRLIVVTLTVLVVLVGSTRVWALGMEDFGNKPLNGANFTGWSGVMPVVNDEARVYHSWVNGNEHFYYLGDTESLNNALRNFAQIEGKTREVVLRPGPGITHSFNRKQEIRFGWKLHLIGGVIRGMTELDKGANFWPEHPVLSVYVGGDIQLDQIKIPAGVSVIELADLRKRYLEGLTSTNRTVRGWGSGHLARLDPFNPKDLETLTKMLEDKDDWVRLNVVGALSRFGTRAKTVLPALRQLKTDDERLRKRVAETTEKIENAPDDSAAAKRNRAALISISKFRKSLKRE